MLQTPCDLFSFFPSSTSTSMSPYVLLNFEKEKKCKDKDDNRLVNTTEEMGEIIVVSISWKTCYSRWIITQINSV